jgi:hypothetical protein
MSLLSDGSLQLSAIQDLRHSSGPTSLILFGRLIRNYGNVLQVPLALFNMGIMTLCLSTRSFKRNAFHPLWPHFPLLYISSAGPLL